MFILVCHHPCSAYIYIVILFLVSMVFGMVHPYIFIHFMDMFLILVCCAKRVQNGFLHTLGIILVILQAIHAQDIST